MMTDGRIEVFASREKVPALRVAIATSQWLMRRRVRSWGRKRLLPCARPSPRLVPIRRRGLQRPHRRAGRAATSSCTKRPRLPLRRQPPQRRRAEGKRRRRLPPPKVRATADLRGRGGNLPAPACPRIRRSSSSPPSSPRGVQTANARAAPKRRATTSDIAATSSATFVDGVAVLSRQPFPDGSALFVLADDSVLHLQASGRRVRMWADGRKGRGGAATHGRLKEDEQIAAASPGRRSTRRARSSSGAGSISSAASDAMWRALPVPLRTSTCDERSSRIL